VIPSFVTDERSGRSASAGVGGGLVRVYTGTPAAGEHALVEAVIVFRAELPDRRTARTPRR
jgi:hypothetical protein